MLGVTKRSEAFGDIGLLEWPDARPDPGCVVLKTAGAGICGADLHIFKNEYKAAPPVIMGHEVSGYVEQVGEGVDSARIGRRFVAETFFSTCGDCAHCRSGRRNLRPSRKSIGSHVDGAHGAARLHSRCQPSRASRRHERRCRFVGRAVGLRDEFALRRCPLHRTRRPSPRDWSRRDRAHRRASGAPQGGEVTLRGAERDRRRLDLAEILGFRVSEVGDEMRHDAFDFVIECSGNAHGYADALRFLRKAGHLAQMGLSGAESSLPVDLVCYKELTITSSFASTPRSWRRAMRLMHSGRLDPQSLVSATLPLSHGKEAFDRSFALDGVQFVLDPRLDER